MSVVKYIVLVAMSLLASYFFGRPLSHTRMDYWLEQRGLVYVTCHREGSFDPVMQFALFNLPIMARKLIHVPLTGCSAEGVRFPIPRTAAQVAIGREAMGRDFAGLVLAVIAAVMLVDLRNAVARRFQCRNL